MRKNYFAKKFVAYSMAFAVAFTTLTVSPVFVKDAKATETTSKVFASAKETKNKVFVSDDNGTTNSWASYTENNMYDGAVWLSTVTSDDVIKGTTVSTTELISNTKFGTDSNNKNKLKKTTVEAVGGKIQDTATLNYEIIGGNKNTTTYTGDSDKVVPEEKKVIVGQKDAVTLPGVTDTQGVVWFKLVPGEGKFTYPEADANGVVKNETITYTYYTLRNVSETTSPASGTNDYVIKNVTSDSLGMYIAVSKKAATKLGFDADNDTIVDKIEKFYNVCEKSDLAPTIRKEDTYAVKGSTAKITIDTVSSKNATYTWYKGTTDLKNDSATLTIENVKDEDFVTYRCEVSDGINTYTFAPTLKELTTNVITAKKATATVIKTNQKVLNNGDALPTGRVTLTTSIPNGDYHYIWVVGASAANMSTADVLAYDSTKRTATLSDDTTIPFAITNTTTVKCFAVPSSIYDIDPDIKEAKEAVAKATNDADKFKALTTLRTKEYNLTTTGTNVSYEEQFSFERTSAKTENSEVKVVKMGDSITLKAPTLEGAEYYAWKVNNGATYVTTKTTKDLVIDTVDIQDLGQVEVTVSKCTKGEPGNPTECNGSSCTHTTTPVGGQPVNLYTKVVKTYNLVCESDLAATADNVTSKVGQKNIDLKVNATSTLPVKYTWYKQVYNPAVGHKVFEDATNAVTPVALDNTNEDQSKFTIPTVALTDFYIGEKADSYQYMCEVTDGINTIQVPVRVGQIETYKVYENQAKLDEGKDITQEQAGYTVKVADYSGNKVKLAPIVVAASEDIEKQLTYQWTKDGVNCSTDKALEVECTDTATTYALTVSEGTNTTTITYDVKSLKEEDLKNAVLLADIQNEHGNVIGTRVIVDVDVERNVIYTGKEINPVSKVYLNVAGKGTYTLKEGTDYDVELTDAINAGVSLYKVVLKGVFAEQYNKFTNNQKEQLSGTFTITRADNKIEIADNTVVLGKSVQPETVTNLGKGALTYTYYVDADAATEIAAPTKVGTYYVKATANATMNYNEAESNVAKVVVVPGKVKMLGTSRTASSVKLNWNKATGATSYRVYYKAAGAKSYKVFKNTTATSMNVTGLASATTYTFAVKAYAKNAGYSTVYATKKTTTAPAKVATPSVTAGSKKATVKFTKVARATGYQIYMAKGNGSYVKVKTTSTASFTKTGLAKGATYKFKVRAYKTVGSNTYYGAFSSAKAVVVK